LSQGKKKEDRPKILSEPKKFENIGEFLRTIINNPEDPRLVKAPPLPQPEDFSFVQLRPRRMLIELSTYRRHEKDTDEYLYIVSHFGYEYEQLMSGKAYRQNPNRVDRIAKEKIVEKIKRAARSWESD
jgi:hypothetical protein